MVTHVGQYWHLKHYCNCIFNVFITHACPYMSSSTVPNSIIQLEVINHGQFHLLGFHGFHEYVRLEFINNLPTCYLQLLVSKWNFPICLFAFFYSLILVIYATKLERPWMGDINLITIYFRILQPSQLSRILWQLLWEMKLFRRNLFQNHIFQLSWSFTWQRYFNWNRSVWNLTFFHWFLIPDKNLHFGREVIFRPKFISYEWCMNL